MVQISQRQTEKSNRDWFHRNAVVTPPPPLASPLHPILTPCSNHSTYLLVSPLPPRHSRVRDEVINNCRHILYTLLVFFTSGISQFFARISSSSFSLYLAAVYIFLFCLFIHHFTFSSSLAVLSFLTIQARHAYLLFTLKLIKFMISFPVV